MSTHISLVKKTLVEIAVALINDNVMNKSRVSFLCNGCVLQNETKSWLEVELNFRMKTSKRLLQKKGS